MQFLNRTRELEALSRAFGADASALFVLYGRRRIGKTELLHHFLRERPHVFFTGDLGTPAQHVRALCSRLGDFDGNVLLQRGGLVEWRAVLDYLEHRKEPLDLVLDEFPYLCQAEPSLPSLLQVAWDRSLRDSQTRLVLCGSSVAFMEQEVLAEPSPLFGRRTGQLRLRALDFWSSQLFFPQFEPAERLAAFACLGGTPAYLSKLASVTRLAEGLRDKVLDPVSYLHEEPRLLLHQELRELKHYFALLASLAAGHTRVNEIAQDVGLERSFVGRYLDVLMNLELVGRELPATEKNPERSRKGLYHVLDPFFRFWFRFVAPNLTELSLGEADWVWRERVAPHLDHFVAPVFESICAQWVQRQGRTGDLPFRPQRAGRWWDGREEIDVLAYDDEWLLLGECKWSQRRVGPPVLERLRERGRRLPGFERHRRIHVFFSRAGFEPMDVPADVRLVDLEELVLGC